MCSTRKRWNFNPRSREGSDARRSRCIAAAGNFNPRSREGSDQLRCDRGGLYEYFNPRSREGSDGALEAERENQKNFNPRSREGSDDYCYKRGDVTQISIHAPAKGATYMQAFQQLYDRAISIHAPAKGATFCRENKTKPLAHFNPRSREGSDA